MAEEFCIVIFPSTHMALSAEKAAEKAGMQVKMGVVPRKISPDCNMGMAVNVDGREKLKVLLTKKDIECNFVDWNP